MFKNVGKKIMTLAKVLTILDLVGAIIIGIAFDEGFLGFIYGILIGVFAVIMCWPIYGFGQLVDDVHAMRKGMAIPSKTIVEENEIPEL